MLSVAAIGSNAEELTNNISNICLGAGSIWERLHAAKAKICNLNLDPGSTFIHYFERLMNVPYRRDIRMDGFCVDDGERVPHHVVYAGRDLDDPAVANCRDRYFEISYARGLARRCAVGRGFISAMSFDDTASLLERELRADPWLLTVAGQKKASRSFA
jgi:aminoglycoside 3-N-acetyltransferase